MTSLLQADGWVASTGPASLRLLAKTEIRDGSGGSAAGTVAWLQSYFEGAVVVTVPAPASGPAVTVVLGSDFTQKAFPAPSRG